MVTLTQWAFVLIYIVVMFLFAGQETSSASVTTRFLAKWLPQLDSAAIRNYVVVFRKTGHILAYGFLTLLVYFAARKTKKIRYVSLPFAVVFALLIAVVDERYQSRLPHRTGSWVDVAIDGVGITLVAVGIWIGTIMEKKKLEVMEDVEDELI